MDVSRLESAITPRTRRHRPGPPVRPVRRHGRRQRGRGTPRHSRVVEDCAQSTGADYRGRRAGSMSTLSAFSFYPTKILGAYGDGGMVLTGDEALARRLRRLRAYGTEGTYYAEEHGYNSRLDELHAEILRRKLQRIERYIERRIALARRYDEQLRRHRTRCCRSRGPAIVTSFTCTWCGIRRGTPSSPRWANRAYRWAFTIRGRSTRCVPIAQFGGGEGSLPVTEQAAREIFSLPMYPSLSDAEQDRVCEALRVSLRSGTRRAFS